MERRNLSRRIMGGVTRLRKKRNQERGDRKKSLLKRPGRGDRNAGGGQGGMEY